MTLTTPRQAVRIRAALATTIVLFALVMGVFWAGRWPSSCPLPC
jgi:hypothetical protein